MGHRGAAAIEPENTLLSIKKAMDIGVDGIGSNNPGILVDYFGRSGI
ncbi:MAG: hypothetical protein Q7J15_09965 [Candidatus Desulfaltia sp.]|nr:hypothetical protein [Candidatus Desulfaltia sp.]